MCDIIATINQQLPSKLQRDFNANRATIQNIIASLKSQGCIETSLDATIAPDKYVAFVSGMSGQGAIITLTKGEVQISTFTVNTKQPAQSVMGNIVVPDYPVTNQIPSITQTIPTSNGTQPIIQFVNIYPQEDKKRKHRRH